MKTTLIPMTDYVISQNKNLPFVTRFTNCENYATKLKLPLKKGYFVPCDENNNILEEPIETIGGVELYAKRYNQAKAKVLFEGCVYESKPDWYIISNDTHTIWFSLENIGTIEDLIKYNLPLTPYGKQFFGL